MKKALIASLLFAAVIQAQDLAGLFPRAKGEGCFKKSLGYEVNIPRDATPFEILAAAEAVNRLCQERIEIPDHFYTTAIASRAELVILLREKLRNTDPAPQEVKESVRALAGNQALVRMYQFNRQMYLLVSGKGKHVHRAATAFFSRYPYFSELLGPEVSATHAKVKDALKVVTGKEYRIREILYEFPDADNLKKMHLDKFRFPACTIGKLLAENGDRDEKAVGRLRQLSENRPLGRETGVLSFPDIRCLHVVTGGTTVPIPRTGATLPEMTPPYKPFLKKKIKPYTASLENVLTTGGTLADMNEDGFADACKSPVIVNEKDVVPELIDLVGGLSSHLTGTSFPLFQLDSEVDDIAQLDFPVLYGPNNVFFKELLERGKIKKEMLEKSAIRVLNSGLGPSPLLLVTDRMALDFWVTHFDAFKNFNWDAPTLLKSFSDFCSFFDARGGGDLPYFRHLREKLQPDSFSAYVSDRFDMETDQKDFLPGAQKIRYWNESQTVKEWDLPIRSETERIVEEIEKSILPKINTDGLLRLEVRVSESPKVRADLEKRLIALLARAGQSGIAVEVNSAYKFGYFYLLERFLPRLAGKNVDRILIRTPLLVEDPSRPRRFYQDPMRWLMELYPVDEAISRKQGIPLEKVEIFSEEKWNNTYVFSAMSGDRKILEETVPIFPYSRPYMSPLKEWGYVQVAGGRIIGTGGSGILFNQPFATDLEVFWNFYQDEVLPFLLDHVRKKTGNNPKLDNQPFFQQLKVEVNLSEPDLRTGIDEEMVSSLEAIHDEIYFDTLDLLAGILNIEKSDKLFNMRKSSPGNVLPLVHPSNEGQEGRVKISLTDYAAREPQLLLSKDGQEIKKTFPDLSEVKIEMNGLEFTPCGKTKTASGNCITGALTVRCEKEADFSSVNGMLSALSNSSNGFRDALLDRLAVETKFKEDTCSFSIALAPISPEPAPVPSAMPVIPEKILSPAEAVLVSRSFSSMTGFQVFQGGKSLEKRELPAIFAVDPGLHRFSLSKLLLEKPTLFFSARQHSNEVSSTTYVLQMLQKLAGDPGYAPYLKSLNILVMPVENPDGADLAFELQKLTPNHSLHAGRYTAKGVDVGYVQDDDKPSVPEALARPILNRTFKPDLYLNLHGYPSHEWVQPFSGYIPFLFRSYWIPKGMFFYYNYVNRREEEEFQKIGRQLLRFLARGLTDLPGNQKFFQRYRRWSERWAPHLNIMDMEGGSLIFHRRENAAFQKLTLPITQVANETPELMDETAQGDWFKELLKQGETYLKLHLDFFSQMQNEYTTDHYAESDRVFFLHKRLRPGTFLGSGLDIRH